MEDTEIFEDIVKSEKLSPLVNLDSKVEELLEATLTRQDVSEDVASCGSNTLASNLDTYLMERRLIQLVRKQTVLYNSRHSHFQDESYKEELWQEIATHLSLEVDKCMSIWAELRYKFQRHVRRLRKYRREMQTSRGLARGRPIMLHEEDLLFLLTHVATKPVQLESTCDTHDLDLSGGDDDVTIVPPPPADIIDLDEDYSDQYKLSADQLRLINAVRAYPQLYETHHPSYMNYRHRGLIWGAISNELHEKATKLMKIWLQLHTRYEWELTHSANVSSKLKEELSFLEPYVREVPGTVCKMSLYLQDVWFDPIEHFRSVMNMINVLRTMPELCQMVNDYKSSKVKPTLYHDLWQRVATQVNVSSQRCEVTWLILRNFYMELAEMRRTGYQLQDKWFFENVIGSLYKYLAVRAVRRTQKRARYVPLSKLLTNKPAPVQAPTPLPLAIIYPPAQRSTATTTTAVTAATTTTASTASSTTNSTSPSSASNSALSSFYAAMPRLSPAITVTHKPATAADLPNLVPKPQPLSLPLPIPCTVQLASATNVRVSPSVPAVKAQTPLRPKVSPLKSFLSPQTGVTKLRAIAPAPSKSSAPGVTPSAAAVPKPSNVSPMLASLLDSSIAPSTSALPMTVPIQIPIGGQLPMPKLVPLTVRNDKILLPPSKTWPVPSSPPALLRKPQSLQQSSTSDAQTSNGNSNDNSSSSSSSNGSSSSNSSKSNSSSNSCTDLTSGDKPTTTSPTPASANSIKAEFIYYPQAGNMLQVRGGGMPATINLNMPRTALFIREILAVPQLHSTEPQLVGQCEDLWLQICKKFHMPAKVCRAIWAYLADNMHMFPQVAPMVELMRPFKTSLKVWEKSHRLFSKFDEIARKYLWMTHKNNLPLLMQHFEKYEHLYWDMRRARPGELEDQPPRQFSDKERQEVWRIARERFPNMNHRDVWSMFKFAFRTYMEDLERGVENPWPQNWWHALEQLKFLVNVRYHPLEPYYYIVHNKLMEEVKRCSMYEALMQPTTETESTYVSNTITTSLLPWETEEAKRLLSGKLPCTEAAKPVELEAETEAEPETQERQQQPQQQEKQQEEPVQEQVEHNEIMELKPMLEQPEPSSQPVQQEQIQEQTASASVKLQRQPVTELTKFLANDMYQLPNLDPYQLTRTLRLYPNTYAKASTADKRSAWISVAKQLNSNVTECRLSLQYAVREQRILKICDIGSRCMLSNKYYRHMTEIFRQVRTGGHLVMCTHTQLKKALAEPTNVIYPDLYVPDINTTNCKPRLVVRNWAYAVGNFPMSSQEELRLRLTDIFARHAAMAKIDWPMRGIKRSNGMHSNTMQEQEQDDKDIPLLDESESKRQKLEINVNS